ncbi:endolytic transglycosylase MltG [Geobacter sp. AOG1]|uniref:endolytic transglycosylase MltG n=1 Tax=Geobacter sp. AOG1 TaxID=1566346 RepID=UPI001CC46DF1|nr:endolytic transglycosylase MltG [Geobacter sp. AOG1]GFE56186.1 aminodeoxychorismate lyase [Geobacter sp. AOG1]
MKASWRKKRQRLAICILAAVLLTLACSFGMFVFVPAGTGKRVEVVELAPGAPFRRIAADLEEKRIITSGRLFVLLARLRGATAKVQAGPYQVSDGMTPGEILDRMVTGDVYVQRFAVPEGYSIYQIAELLEGRRLFPKGEFLRACADRQFLAELGIPARSAEGYLYPSTYNIPPGTTPAQLIRQMVEQFDKVFGQKFASRVGAAGLSKGELVTMASMIEKEAVIPEERPLIASVFLNRLRSRMPLQSDPTAVYGVRAFAGSVSRRDIQRVSPYNTYLIKGLPPGPIGNPGSDAIEAVLNPAQTAYYYFVAKKDGSHHFSATLAEHNRAVNRYLKSAAAPNSPSSGSVAGYQNDRPNLTGRR